MIKREKTQQREREKRLWHKICVLSRVALVSHTECCVCVFFEKKNRGQMRGEGRRGSSDTGYEFGRRGRGDERGGKDSDCWERGGEGEGRGRGRGRRGVHFVDRSQFFFFVIQPIASLSLFCPKVHGSGVVVQRRKGARGEEEWFWV